MTLKSTCRLLLALGLVLPLDGASSPCTTGTYETCEGVGFVPGHNLGGKGFDIATLERKDAFVFDMETSLIEKETCTLCVNSLLQGRVQKLPLAMANWRALPQRSCEVKSRAYNSSAALVKDGSPLVNADPSPVSRTSASVRPWSGTLTYTMGKASESRYSFSSQEVSCAYYWYSLKETAALDPGFLALLKSLPKVYNHTTKEKFRQLIDTYGTHYIRQVELGGRVRAVTALPTRQLETISLTVEEVKDCLGVEASQNVRQQMDDSRAQKCELAKSLKLANANFSRTFGQREVEVIGGGAEACADPFFSSHCHETNFTAWLNSLKSSPDIISYTLVPLYDLTKLPGLTPKTLRRAISDYVKERAVERKCICPRGSTPSQVLGCTCNYHSNNLTACKGCPPRKKTAHLWVEVKCGHGLWGDYFTKTDGYVKVFFHGREFRTRVINNSNNPVWNEVFDFGIIILHRLMRLEVEVWDSDSGWKSDEKLGWWKGYIELTSSYKDVTVHNKHGKVIFAYKLK
ncbi:perforin-1-like [Latimeria chalumnae]|uniref:perforin-1-like n=1 Tax=Latimeria chalumnae TaxID=7897 RepID=UPI00313D38E8